MSKVYEIAFQMGGQLTGAFSKTMRGANAALGDLQENIKKLNAQSADISSLQKMQRSVGELSREYNQAQQKAQQLAQELRETENPTKKQQQEFDRARKSASRLKQELVEQRGELQRLRTSISTAGESTRELVQRQKELAAAAEKARKAQAGLQKTIAAQDANMAKRQELRGQLFDAAGLAVAMAAPIKLAADWEQQLAELNKVANATPGELKGISQSAQELAVQTGVAREQIIGAYTAAAQAGFARNEWAKFAETSAKMGVAFDTTGEQAGEMLKAWRSGMALTMDQATELAGAANHLANNMNATALGIGSVLQRQGAVFKTAGVDQTTGAALAASLLSSGASDEVAATAGKNFVLALTQGAAATAKQKDALAMLGFEDPQALAKQMQEAPQQAIMSVLESIRSLDADQQTAVITQLFGRESIGGIAPLIGNLENLSNAFELVGKQANYANSLEEEFNALQSTTNQQAKKAWESVKALGTAFGAVLLPPLNSLLQTLAPIALGLANLAQEFPLITKVVVGSVAALVALKVASIAVGYAWTFVKGGALQIIKVLKVAKIAWMLNTGAMTANATTSKAAVVASKVLAAAQWLLNKAIAGGKWLWQRAQIIATTALQKKATIAAKAGAAAQWLMNAAVAGGKWVWLNAQMALAAARTIAFSAAQKTAAIVSKAVTAAQWAFNAALMANPIGLIIAAIVALIAAGVALYKNWDKVTAFASTAWNAVKNYTSAAIDWMINAFMNFTPVGWIMKAFGAVKNWLSGFSIKGVTNKIIDGAKWAFLNLTPLGWSIKAFSKAKEWLSGFSLKGVTKTIINGVKWAFLNLTPIGWVVQAFSKAKNWLSNFSLFDSGKKIIQTLASGIMSAGGALIDGVKGIFSSVRDYLPFSDAKVGPFSELTKSGAAIMNTLADGVHQTPNLQNAVSSKFQETAQATGSERGSGLLNQAMKTNNATTGGGGFTITLNQTINVNGGSGDDVQEQARKGAAQGAEELLEQLQRALGREKRLSYA